MHGRGRACRQQLLATLHWICTHPCSDYNCTAPDNGLLTPDCSQGAASTSLNNGNIQSKLFIQFIYKLQGLRFYVSLSRLVDYRFVQYLYDSLHQQLSKSVRGLNFVLKVRFSVTIIYSKTLAFIKKYRISFVQNINISHKNIKKLYET